MQNVPIKRENTNAHTGNPVSHTLIAKTPNINEVTEKNISTHFASRIDGTNGI
jgi:hypothetical protein